MKLKKVLLWALAVIISLGAMFYQRMTGPTYPKKFEVSYQNEDFSFSLPRSNNGRPGDYPVEIQLPESFSGKVIWRLFPTENPWETLVMERKGDTLSTSLPHQPPAGKIEYHLELIADGKVIALNDDTNVVIRFR
ncbi:MAG: hypothetical protein E4H10_04750, partial [Bacteroidia bacterium]